MGYTLSNKAEEDILNIFEVGVELFGIHQAEKYHDHLEKTFEFLAANPLAAPQRLEITPAIRIHPTGSHLVVYTISDEGIYIVRVRHGYEDWMEDRDKGLVGRSMKDVSVEDMNKAIEGMGSDE